MGIVGKEAEQYRLVRSHEKTRPDKEDDRTVLSQLPVMPSQCFMLP